MTGILAMSADGKIADRSGHAARFGSPTDQARLQAHIAEMDGVILGARTLRAYGSSVVVRDPKLLALRQSQGRSPQPVQIVCSASGNLAAQWRFFRQDFPRWLITQAQAQEQWWLRADVFERILVAPLGTIAPDNPTPTFNWPQLGEALWDLGLRSIGILGGGTLMASCLHQGTIDDLHLTICPLLLGGNQAPSPVANPGFLEAQAPNLHLCQWEVIDQEVFLHYRVMSP